MPTELIHRIGVVAPTETIYGAIRLKVAEKVHGKKK